MNVQLRHVVLAAALGVVITTGFAQLSPQQPGIDHVSDFTSKEAAHERMHAIAEEIDSLRMQFGTQRRVASLADEYKAISAWLGGDDPAALHGPGGGAPLLPPAPTLPSACGVVPTTVTVNGTTGPINPGVVPGPTTFTAVVSGAGPSLWDVNLNTFITHTNAGNLDVSLQSPAGTVVVITTDNGGTNDDVFNGTVWDDNVNDPVTDRTFTNAVIATPLSPEGRLQAFRGENPNGTWTLLVFDDGTADTGAVNSWSLDIRTLAAAPVTTTTTVTKTPGLAIGPGVATTSDTVAVAGAGTSLHEVTLFLEITHTNPTDLDITLTSPGGTVVKVTTDNGSTFDNVFNGTLFDPTTLDTVTDHVYANAVVAPLLSPEGAFDNFLGQNPNGTWTLTVADDLAAGGGTLVRWDLNVTTIPAPTPSAAVNYAGTTGPIPDFVAHIPTATTYTAVVSGVGPSLWDVDLTTAIPHEFSADLDITLTSPGGTVVTITTDNGGAFDNVFNGTLWDDNVNAPATDFTYANAVVATPLSPEGRLAAFRGENPNGTWTLTVTDDGAGDIGSVNSWSLSVSTLAAAPSQTTTSTTDMPNLAISATGTPTVSDMMTVSGNGPSITKVTLFLEVPHTFGSDLDITLTSPGGTAVIVTTDNAGGNDNTFNGTLFDPDLTDTVTDHVYTNNVVAPLLSPEGSFDNFVGENPNGSWTLTVADDAGADGGTFVRWTLNISTCTVTPSAFNAYCFGNGTAGANCPCGPGAAGNGCPNSGNPAGANLAGTGLASIAADTAVLAGSGMAPFSPVLYYQGTTRIAVVFGDGLQCVGGSVIRLGVKYNDGTGSSSYPSGSQSISVRGMVSPGVMRSYQGWYRDAAIVFCLPATFNLTNGVQVTWGH